MKSIRKSVIYGGSVSKIETKLPVSFAVIQLCRTDAEKAL
jgi:hypothetical protein